ncbi:MAG TPA: ribonuclease Z, partial [Anaerolineae bacterium]|nr:ribonuclease Z [Anaerolineae bacterium]
DYQSLITNHFSLIMFELIFLGTSASAPSIRRGLPAQMVIHNEQRFMIDCGEGTQRQLLKSGLGFKRLDKILLTHGHLDHILGLAGLLSTLIRWETLEALSVYGGRAALDRVEDLIYKIVLREAQTEVEIKFKEIKPGKLFEDKFFELTAFPVTHRGSGNFGYLFREKNHRPFLADRAEALNVPFGPERKLLVNGQSITLSDGRVIQPDDVLGPEVLGASLAMVGDAARTDNLLEHVRGVDTLVIESTYLDVEADLARDHGHLTATQSARLAVEAGVRQLILTHISRRYGEREVQAEARAIFAETIVARDFDHYRIQQAQAAQRVLAETLADAASAADITVTAGEEEAHVAA